MRNIPIPDADTIADAFNADYLAYDAVSDDIVDAVKSFAESVEFSHAVSYAIGFADAWVYCHTRPASGDPDPDTRGTGDGRAFADTAAHNIATAVALSQPHSALTHTLCDTYASAYRAAYDRLQHLAVDSGGTGAGLGRPGDDARDATPEASS